MAWTNGSTTRTEHELTCSSTCGRDWYSRIFRIWVLQRSISRDEHHRKQRDTHHCTTHTHRHLKELMDGCVVVVDFINQHRRNDLESRLPDLSPRLLPPQRHPPNNTSSETGMLSKSFHTVSTHTPNPSWHQLFRRRGRLEDVTDVCRKGESPETDRGRGMQAERQISTASSLLFSTSAQL